MFNYTLKQNLFTYEYTEKLYQKKSINYVKKALSLLIKTTMSVNATERMLETALTTIAS